MKTKPRKTTAVVMIGKADLARYSDTHSEKAYERIAKLDRLAVQAEALAIQIAVTNHVP